MKIFKSTDRKLKEIGFKKTEENEYGADYERENKEFGYCESLEILRKANGRHIAFLFEKGCNSDGYNNAIGMTYYEMKLVTKKMKEMNLTGNKKGLNK